MKPMLFSLFGVPVVLAGCAAVGGCARPQTASAPSVVEPMGITSTGAVRMDQWWRDRHAQIVEKARAGGHEVVFLGDSITQGWEGAGKDVWAKDIEARHALNAGIGGDKTQHVIGRLEDGLLDAIANGKNDVRTVVVLIGTNNFGPPADSPREIALGVSRIVSLVLAKLPNARVVVMGVLPRGRWVNWQREAIVQINDQLRVMMTNRRVKVLDIGDKYIAAGGEIPPALMPDALHLSEAGYQIWSDALKGELGAR